MDKYRLLMILNTPLVLYGIAMAYNSRKKGNIRTIGLVLRTLFWLAVLGGLWFAREIYDFLVVRGLTDSTPLSIADVVLVTGLSFCLFLILRLYSMIDAQERQFTALHEALSIELSERKGSGKR